MDFIRRIYFKRKTQYYFLLIVLLVWLFIGLQLNLQIDLSDQTVVGNITEEKAYVIPPGDEGIGEIRNERSLDDASRKGIIKRVLGALQPDRIRSNLFHITRHQHLAGSPEENELGEWLARKWSKKGMDKVEKTPYDVLLQFPSSEPGEKNKVELIYTDENGEEHVVYESQDEEQGEHMMLADDYYLQPYNAFAKPGIVEGDLVYVNYGKNSDFRLLEKLGISVKGKIAIARYGKGYRGEKVKWAEKYGVKGLVLYTEPAPSFFIEITADDMYPHGVFRPRSGVQRGTLLEDSGDPQTPGYPSLKSAYRLPTDQLKNMPQIPVQPISSDDATVFLSNLTGYMPFFSWRGELNVSYTTGPGYDNSSLKVRLSVFNKFEKRTVFNVIGTIYGREEPDRYVVIGSHRDAWTYGGVDAGSSNAIMMEVANVYLALLKDGWRPRRTLKFCSWASEEFGLMGSWEWVEQFSKILYLRAVAYLNLDIIMMGNYTIGLSGSPLMKKVLWNTAKQIPDPVNEIKSLYETWRDKPFRPIREELYPEKPKINSLASGSDFASFIAYIGVPSMQSIYEVNIFDHFYHPDTYPTYHTLYDNFHVVDSYLDPDYSHHLAVGQLYGVLVYNLANSQIVPFDVREYARDVQYHYNLLNNSNFEIIKPQNISFYYLEEAINELNSAAKRFHQKLRYINKRDKYTLRAVNDQLIYFERAFIDNLGLPDRPFVKHVIFAHNQQDRYASSKFPGIFDSLYEIDRNTDPNKWEVVKKQISAVEYAVRSATTIIQPLEDI